LGSSKETKFTDEFWGPRRSYRISGDIQGTCRHGEIVRDLRKAVESLKIGECGNDRPRDLFVASGKRVKILFEVKPDCLPSSIYTAIGQLLIHSASEKHQPHRVLVVPKGMKPMLADRLRNLGIDALHGKRAAFINLNQHARNWA